MTWLNAYPDPKKFQRPDDDDPPPRRERWHVGKEVPLALIFTIMTSVASGIWYASRTDARITQIEKTVEASSSIKDELIQLKEQVRGLDRILTRMETMLDRRAHDDDGEQQKTDLMERRK